MDELIIERRYVASVDESNAVNAAGDKRCPRSQMADFYADAMISDGLAKLAGKTRVDFAKINKAILARWSFSGLNYIKTKAWKLFNERAKQTPVPPTEERQVRL